MKPASLLAALNLAKSSLGSNDSVYPVLAHFCFDDDIVYAYNDVTSIIVGEKTGLHCALHGDTLLGILSVAGSDDIEVKITDGAANLKLKSGWVKVPALPADQFLFSWPEEEPTLTIPFTEQIAKAIERCLMSVNTDNVRQEFTGVSIHIKAGRLNFFSSDNATATRYIPEEKFVGKGEFSAVIPQAACEQMLKLRKDGAQLKVNGKFGVFEQDDVTLMTKLLPAGIGVFEGVFAEHVDNTLNFPLPDELAREIAKANVLLARESVKECILTCAPGSITITAAGVLGSMKATIKTPLTGTARETAKGTVRIDPTHVLRAIQHADHFTVNDQKSLVLVGGAMAYVISSKLVAAAPPPTAKAGPSDIPDDDIPF